MPSDTTFDRTAGSHLLAAAGHLVGETLTSRSLSSGQRSEALSRWRGAQLGLLCLVVLGTVLIGRFSVHAQGATDTRLEIEIRRGLSLPVEHYALGCNPPTGTVSDPAAACNRIADLVGKVNQPSGGQSLPVGPGNPGAIVCAQVYGGPEVALVRGRFLGALVDARLTRENGCTLSSYDATMKLLGIP